MDEFTLTKEAAALICVLYKEFLDRRNNGIEKDIARSFGDANSIAKLTKKWSASDTADTCRELHKAGLLNCLFVDNTVGESMLTTKAISYMEGRFGRKLSSLVNFLEKLIPFIRL